MTTLVDDRKNPEGVTVAVTSAESAEVIRVLHIDDEEQQQMFLKVFVEGDPSIKVTSVLCAKDVLDLVETGAYDCLVSDYDMPDMDGITLAKKVRQTSQIPIIIYTGRGSEEVAERAFEAGIDDYIRKEMSPAHYQVLSKRIRQAVERRRSNESYKNLFDSANDSIILHTLDGKILDINEAGCRKLGYPKEELLCKIIYDHATPNSINHKDLYDKIRKQGHAVFESTIKSRDGSLIPVEVSNKVIKYMGVDAVLSFNRDITERKRRERDLVRLATFPQLNPNPIVEADLSGRVHYTNPAAALKFPELSRARSMASLGLDWGQIVAQLQSTDDGKLFRDAKIDGVWYALSVDVVAGSDRVRVYATDIDERVRVEESLRLSEESYRDLFENASDAISIVAFDGHIIDVNDVGCRRLGYSKEELQGMTINQYVASPGFDFNDYLEKITRKGYAIFESTHVARDGKLIPVEVNAKIIKHEGVDVILSFSRDISDRKRLEAQMKERLEALQNHALELSRCEDVTAVAKTTYKILKETMDYHFFGLGIVKDNLLSFIPDVITDSDWVKDYPFDTPSVCVRAVKTGSAIVVPDVRLDPDYIGPKTGYKYLSEVVVPVKIGDKVVGVINVEDEKVNRFTRDDAMLLEVFSEHVASAINRIEILEKTRRYVARIDAMNRHTARLAKLNTVKEVADFSMDVIQDLLGFQDGCIGVVEGDTIKFKFARNLTFSIPDLLVSGRGITARAVRTGKSQLVDDTRLDPDFVKDLDPAEFLSELDVPVKIDDRVIAVINLEDPKPGFFGEEDREVVETLAVRIGSSMRRIKLLESVSHYKANLEVLHRHAQSLANIGSVEEVAAHTFDIIKDLLGFTEGAFGVVEADNLRFIYTNPIPVERFPLMPLSGGWVTVRAVKTGESQLVPDVRSDSGFVNYIDSFSPLSELAVPVSLDGGVVAVINLEKGCLNAFTEEDRRILEVLAEHVASAMSRIEYLRLIRESEDDLIALHNHAHVLNDLQSIEEVAKATLKILHTHLKCNLLSMRTSDGENLTMLARWGAKPIGKPIPIKGKGLMAKAAREKQALLVNDTRADPDFIKGNNHALSELVIPILFREELLGVLNAESLELNAFSDNEKILMEALADEVGSTIVRIRSLENERIYNLKLKALNISSIKFNKAKTIDDALDIACEIIEKIFGYNWGGIGRVSEEAIHYVRVLGTGLDGNDKITLDQRSITVRAVKSGETQLVPDTSRDEDYIVVNPGDSKASSELVVPIYVGSRVEFVINLESMKLNAFSDQDKQLTELLSSHFGSAVELIRKRERLNSLYQHASRIELVTNTAEIAELTLNTLRDVLDFKISSFHMVKGGILEMIRSSGFEAKGRFSQALGGPGLIPYAVRECRSVYVPDVTDDENYVRGPLNLGDEISSELVVPIIIDEISVAAIDLEDKHTNGFTEEDQELVELLAKHVASAIQRIKNYDARSIKNKIVKSRYLQRKQS